MYSAVDYPTSADDALRSLDEALEFLVRLNSLSIQEAHGVREAASVLNWASHRRKGRQGGGDDDGGSEGAERA